MPHLLWLIVFENKLIPYKLAIIDIKLNKINFQKTHTLFILHIVIICFALKI